MFVRGCLYPGCLTLVLGTLSIQQMAPWAELALAPFSQKT